jgi:hypothetical protein
MFRQPKPPDGGNDLPKHVGEIQKCIRKYCYFLDAFVGCFITILLVEITNGQKDRCEVYATDALSSILLGGTQSECLRKLRRNVTQFILLNAPLKV